MSKPSDPLLLVNAVFARLVLVRPKGVFGTNDPAAGSPTAALLRLLLPPDN